MSRKGFNFYRSYFDVAMELPDKDRLAFYDALAKRQFLGEEPTLTGMAKLAYISQKYVIDAQVKGWEDKTGTSLKDVEKQEVNTPCQGGCQGGTEGGCQGGSQGGCQGPSVQEKEKEKEEVKEKVNINIVSSETKIKNEDFERFNNWLDTETKFVRKIKTQMTEEQFIKLKKKYNSVQIMNTVLSLENYKDATKRYTSVYLTVKNWLDKDNNRLNK